MRVTRSSISPIIVCLVLVGLGLVACGPVPVATNATPSPLVTPISKLSPTELKYRLLAEFGPVFYCDPDLYPVARQLTDKEFAQRFAAIQSNAEEFQAILRHNNLEGVTPLSDDQKRLIYAEHKKLNAITLEPARDQYQFSLRAFGDGKNGFAIEGTIAQNGAITVSKKEPSVNACPICLAGDTRIDTPQGWVPVKDLGEGMEVWTTDASGGRRVAVVVEIVSRAVPPDHPMMHLVLDDGRELFASAGHPLPDGRRLGDLSPGDVVDGARVINAESVPYVEAATYDILPSGGTGLYWANGILLKSTLIPSSASGD